MFDVQYKILIKSPGIVGIGHLPEHHMEEVSAVAQVAVRGNRLLPSPHAEVRGQDGGSARCYANAATDGGLMGVTRRLSPSGPATELASSSRVVSNRFRRSMRSQCLNRTLLNQLGKASGA